MPLTMPMPTVAQTLSYTVTPQHANAHVFAVRLAIPKPRVHQRVSLPVWIPGSYLVREFSRHLTHLEASQSGLTVTVTQVNKNTWVLANQADTELTLTWRIYAFDPSVREAYLDAERGFFNGTSLFLRAHGLEDAPHQLRVPPVAKWQLACALEADAATGVDDAGFGHYLANNYDELVDAPVEMGTFWSGEFKVRGVTHQMVVSHAHDQFDGKRLLHDTQKICEAAIKLWHPKAAEGLPHTRYVFFIQANATQFGGLEHQNSTALICPFNALPHAVLDKPQSREPYRNLLGLIAHEYFHTWNVKRLRPDDFARYDYDQEQYTELLWFFEGFTSYYENILLQRAGLVTAAQHDTAMAALINQVRFTPGRKVQSAAKASYDAWVKYYRSDENTPNLTVSYYTKGALIAWCLDLSLRQLGLSLDYVMRALWLRCAAGPMGYADIDAVLHTLTHASLAKQLRHWVSGVADLPIQKLLTDSGVQVTHEDAPLAARLGIRVQVLASFDGNNRLVIKSVYTDSAAEQGGLAAGDELLALRLNNGTWWRLQKLEDIQEYSNSKTLKLLAARQHTIVERTLDMPAAKVWRIQSAAGDSA